MFLFVAFFVAFSVTASAQAASISTDRFDYPPGDSVIIYGSGFGSNEIVSVQVTHADGTPNNGNGHAPWSINANGSGAFETYWIVPYDDNLGELLLVTATGQTTGYLAATTFMDANTVLEITSDIPAVICRDTLTPSDSIVLCAELTQHCAGNTFAPLEGREIRFFINPGNCGVDIAQIPNATVLTDSNGVACAVFFGADTIFASSGSYSLRAKFLGEDKPGPSDPPNSACGPSSRVELSNSNDCRAVSVIDNCNACAGNVPPVSSCPPADTFIVCNLNQICVDGFSCFDSDGNLSYSTAIGGTLNGSQICFTPFYGQNTIGLICTDSCGAEDTCYTVITVMPDTTDPVFVNCPGDATFQCDAVPTPPANLTATDDCDPNPVITYLGETITPGNCPQSYTITRRWEVIDDAGNADTCTQVITVVDTTKPVITNCPANTTVQCNAVPTVPTLTATDNCDPTVPVTFLGETTTPGSCPQSFTLTRKWVAIDDCGNKSDTCTQVITVADTTRPTFTNCPTNITVQCDAIPPVVNPTAADNCDATVTVTFLGETTTPGACPQSFTLTRKWEARDDCNNADTCTQVITVQDTTKPTFTNCPANVTVQCDAVPAPASPSATDNCDASVTVTYLGETTTSGACPQSYTLTRKWEARDDCNNADTCTQVITVQDTTKPTFVNCPGPVTVQCNAIPPATNPTATDNCDATPTVTYLGETINPGNCPYTITRKWEARDDCNNADTCVQTITVIDNVKPAFQNCPANVTVQCNAVPPPANPTATDNCDISLDISCTQDSIPGNCPQEYTLIRRCIATDDCGNADTCIQVISVLDTTKPTFVNCPGPVTVECNNVPPPASPTATDNCDASVTVTYLGETTTPGACPQSYTLTRKWEARDDCNNADTCTQVITVQDTTDPTFTNCPPNASAQCNSVPPPANPTATDNCDATPTVTYLGETRIPGSCPNAYTLTRKWSAVDDCTNADTCTQVITVSDTTKIILGADRTIDNGFICLPLSGCFNSPSFTGGCGPFYWTVNGVPTRPDTNICYSAGYCTVFNQTWTFIASDSCGHADTAKVTVKATVNCPPVVTCPSQLSEIRVCSLGVGVIVCVPGNEFTCTDQDGNTSSTTINGQPYNSGDNYCFAATSAGLKTLTLICTDDCGKADTCTSTVNVIVDTEQCRTGCPVVRIEKTHNTIQGQYESVAVTIDSMPYGIGGFDLLIQYDASALGLSLVEAGSFITGCGWEYFTYRMGGCTNCGSSACPSGSVHITAIAEINNGPNHPSCFQMEPAQLAVLTFLVTNDRTFECQYVPIRFMWCDCGDNTFSSVSGDSLYISDQVFDYFDNDNYTDITDLGAPFPSWFGANATCDVDPGNGKPAPIRCIDFYNGGIDIVCADSIDDRGDINMNGLPNEVSDAVLLGNYFIYGIGVFTVNIQGQIAASDVNADGAVLSVADLVYLIRVVIGDAQPYSKVAVPVDVKFTHSEDGRLSVENRTPIGAALVIALGQVQPTLLADGMEVIHNFDGTNTRILVWSISGNSFTGDFLQINAEVTSIEMATAEGNPVALNVVPTEFSLHQNYPNPFNPKTVISFTLPTASDYKLAIYNVNGQEVALFTGLAENAGTFEVEWEAANYASGIYFYKLVAGPHSQIKKMILLK